MMTVESMTVSEFTACYTHCKCINGDFVESMTVSEFTACYTQCKCINGNFVESMTVSEFTISVFVTQFIILGSHLAGDTQYC